MTPPVLVTGATGRVGRAMVAHLLDAGVPVRALTRRPDAAGLPAAVEVVAGDLGVPESLDRVLQGAGAVFLLWTAPPATAPAVIERLASHAPRVVFFPIRFQELTPDDFRHETAGTWPRPIVDMLLAAWGATIGHPAFVTSLVADVVGSPARTFREWVLDHAEAF